MLQYAFNEPWLTAMIPCTNRTNWILFCPISVLKPIQFDELFSNCNISWKIRQIGPFISKIHIIKSNWQISFKLLYRLKNLSNRSIQKLNSSKPRQFDELVFNCNITWKKSSNCNIHTLSISKPSQFDEVFKIATSL